MPLLNFKTLLDVQYATQCVHLPLQSLVLLSGGHGDPHMLHWGGREIKQSGMVNANCIMHNNRI